MRTILPALLVLITHFSMASWRSYSGQNFVHHSLAETVPDTPAAKSISYTIIHVPDNKFGYDIYVNGKMMIHQASIPAMPGKLGFSLRTDAEKVAQLVVSKIKQGIMPPTITKEEMEKLGVSFK